MPRPPIPQALQEQSPTLTKDELREALKQGIKEWLDDMARQFGWWSLKGLGALMLAGALYLVLTGAGFRR